MAVRIGELLLKEKRITPQQLQEALNFQKGNGGKLGASLVKLGFVRDEDITALLSKQYGVPSINLAQFELDPAVIKLVPSDTAVKYQIVPLSRNGASLTIAMTDPTNVFAMDDIKFMTGYNVEPVVASEIAVLEAIERYYAGATTKASGMTSAGAAGGGVSVSSLDMATRALEDLPQISDDDWPLTRRNGATTSSGVITQISMLPPSSATNRSPEAAPVTLSTPVSGAEPPTTSESS